MSRQVNISARLERELAQLAAEIRTLDQFDQSTTLNIHALSCLMRYAACHDPDEFLAWLQSKRFTVNPEIIDRVELFTDLDWVTPTGKSATRDGVELRVHIFRNGNETFKHTHKQDFISVCLQGAYRYRYFREAPEATSKAWYERYERRGGIQSLIERTPGDVEEITYGVTGEPSPHRGGRLFHEDAPPLFVDARYIHTVEHVSQEPVITFVARRGLCKTETLIVRAEGDEDPRLQNASPPRQATEEERAQICRDLLEALTKHDQASRGAHRYRDIQAYQTPAHKLLFLSAQALSCSQERLLLTLMNKNGVYSLPLLDEEGRCVELLSAPMVREEDRDWPEARLDRQPEPMVVYEHEPLLFAVLGMILNESLVIPVVDSEARLCGLLAVDDLLEVRDSLGQALFWALYEAHKHDDDAVGHVHGLLSALERLREVCLLAEEKVSRATHDLLVHEALTHLDELIWLYPRCNLDHRSAEREVVELSSPLSALTLLEAVVCPLEPTLGSSAEREALSAWLGEELGCSVPEAIVFEEEGTLWVYDEEQQRLILTPISANVTLRDALRQTLEAGTTGPLYVSLESSLYVVSLEELLSPHVTRQLLGLLCTRPVSTPPAQLNAWVCQALSSGELTPLQRAQLLSEEATLEVLSLPS